MSGLGEREGGVITFTFFIALYRVLKHVNHFKAIKKYLITGLGPQPPLRRPPALTSAKTKFDLFFLKPSLRWVSWWAGGKVDGWVPGWMGGWVDGQVGGCNSEAPLCSKKGY